MIITAIASFVLLPVDLPSVAEATKGLTSREGLLPSYVDRAKGRILLKLPKPSDDTGLVGEFLYAESLATGLGANALGLDRGEDGASYVIQFRIRGEQLAIEAVNTGFRADSKAPEERDSVRNSFPTSVLWSGKLAGRDADGTSVADLTGFIVRDAHRSADAMQGYSLDPNRSFLMPEGCLAFPENLEFDARLTFASGKGVGDVGEVSPDDRSVTLTQHHSLVKLPDDGFAMREYDPRSGYFAMQYMDFAAPLGADLTKRVIARHRLELNPDGTVKKPIVYYLDRGVPEPIRSALLEGGNWWSAAFDAAGFKNGFRVEVLPEGVSPLDVRYNVIQWIHRSTRGYSVGGSIGDPRTGEIVKGMVRLDSSRIRQDMLIFEGLTEAGDANKGGANDMTVPGLARIRQLSAHEIGHTLGLRHNFAASTWGGRASVMDYPAPLIHLGANGALDFRDAYGTGVGEWDRFAIWYGYANSTLAERQKRLEDVDRGKMVYLTDEDDAPTGGADWRAAKFDNGNDPGAGLRETMALRKVALAKFGLKNIRTGTPLGQMEVNLGPIYFFHRYAVGSLAKTIGGLEYENTVRTAPGLQAPRPVRAISAPRQKEALDLLLNCVDPEFLDIPKDLANLLHPSTPGYADRREKFNSFTSFAFDSLSAANTAADLVLAELLNPARCVRMVELHSRDQGLPGLETVLRATTDRIFGYAPGSDRLAEIARGVQSVYVDRLMDLVDANVPRSTRSRAAAELMYVRSKLSERAKGGSPAAMSHAWMLGGEIDKFMDRPMGEAKRSAKPLPALPGSPIGCSLG